MKGVELIKDPELKKEIKAKKTAIHEQLVQ